MPKRKIERYEEIYLLPLNFCFHLARINTSQEICCQKIMPEKGRDGGEGGEGGTASRNNHIKYSIQLVVVSTGPPLT